MADRLSTGRETLAQGGIDVVLLDLSLPDSRGLETYHLMHAEFPDLPVVILSGLDDEATAVQAVHEGAADYLFKGEVGGNLLIRAVRYAIERKRIDAMLRLAKVTADDASRAKSDFLANMSHEIRTPMNAIIGLTELVLDSPLNKMQREYLEMVRQSGELLLTIINDILDFSKIEAGKLEFEQIAFSLCDRMGDAMKALAIRAHGKGLELACHIDPETPDVLRGDPARLQQIVLNLCGNAIKFTERGEVVLDVRCDSATAEEAVLHFLVRDTGVGIPPEKLESIFQAFTQGDSSTTRRFGGTGLGLAISSRLVKLMGGRIWVESEVGQGSQFHFTVRLPLASESDIAPPHPLPPETFFETDVLIVDDNATNRLILQEILRSWHMSPVAVSDGAQALAALRAARHSGQPYRLMLSDVNMPEMDGVTLAERVKSDPELSQTEIILLTSAGRSEELTRCGQLGVSRLMKPVKQSELFDAMAATLGITESEEQPQPEPCAEPVSQWGPRRVLVAEDSIVNQKLATALLKKYGHTVVVANNGKEAVSRLARESFDLVLMDVEMPEMDGVEATAVIRVKEKLTGKHLPIIAVTAHAMTGDREKYLQAGMDDYVTKPIRAQQLFEAIQRVQQQSGE
jgi:two-component system, sensor histidine kinase and response regulator